MLKIKYLGLDLKTPIIIGANPFTDNIKYLKLYERSGAGAIVYKTIFQEEVEKENFLIDELIEGYGERNAEMTTIFPERDDTGIEDHLFKIKEIKKELNIPLIVSFNCTNIETWKKYAKAIEEVKADALEINLLFIKNSEEEQLKVIKAVIESVKIPVAVKLSPFYSNIFTFLDQLNFMGVKGVIIYGKYLNFDINLDIQKPSIRPYLSNKFDNGNSLRTIGIYYKENLKMDLCSNTGIFTGKDILKNILAGATCIESVSSILLEPEKVINLMIEEIQLWLKENNYKNLNEVRGLLSEEKNKNLKYTYNLIKYLDTKENVNDLLNRILI